MPSVSLPQHRFMEGVAHNPKFAKEAGVPRSVGQEFVAADAVKPERRTNALARIKKQMTKPKTAVASTDNGVDA